MIDDSSLEGCSETHDGVERRDTARPARSSLTRALGRAFAVVVAMALALAGTAIHARAQAQEPPHWIGAAIGAASLGDDRCNPELGFIRDDSICEDRDTGYKVYAGRRLNDYLAAELVVARLGEASFETSQFIRGVGLVDAMLDGSHNVSLGGTAMTVIPMKRLDAFLKFGPHWWSRDVAFRREESDVNTTGFDLVWGVGVRIRVGSRFSVRAEVERFVIDDYDLNFMSVGAAWRF